jgi:hypothetical protein
MRITDNVISEVMRRLGKKSSPKKAEAARRNGRKHKPAAKAK